VKKSSLSCSAVAVGSIFFFCISATGDSKKQGGRLDEDDDDW
jgi:hypothetical protein